jgi:hypothetical protein
VEKGAAEGMLGRFYEPERSEEGGVSRAALDRTELTAPSALQRLPKALEQFGACCQHTSQEAGLAVDTVQAEPARRNG